MLDDASQCEVALRKLDAAGAEAEARLVSDPRQRDAAAVAALALAAEELRVLQRVLGEVVGLGQPELLALVEVDRARQREQQQGGSAGPPLALWLVEPGARTLGEPVLGEHRVVLGQREAGRVPHLVVVRQHPRRHRADGGDLVEGGRDAVVVQVPAPAGVEEGEVEGLVELVGPHVVGQPLAVDVGLGDHDAVVVLVEHGAPLPPDLVDLVAVQVGGVALPGIEVLEGRLHVGEPLGLGQ